jgi:hypothetical protein
LRHQRYLTSDVDCSKETGKEGGDEDDGHRGIPGHEFTDCGTQAELSAAPIALEISSRKARFQALEKRWDRLRAGLDLLLDQRRADMADLPGGANGLLARDYKGKNAERLVTRIDPSVVSLVAELRGHGRQVAEELFVRNFSIFIMNPALFCVIGVASTGTP